MLTKFENGCVLLSHSVDKKKHYDPADEPHLSTANDIFFASLVERFTKSNLSVLPDSISSSSFLTSFTAATTSNSYFETPTVRVALAVFFPAALALATSFLSDLPAPAPCFF